MMRNPLQLLAVQRNIGCRLAKNHFSQQPLCKYRSCTLITRRFKHEKSDGNDQNLIGEGTTHKQWVLYFAGFSVAVVIATYIKKEREKKMQKEYFEDHIETCTDAAFPGCIKYGGYILPPTTKGCIQEVKNFSLRNEDVLVVSFPKSGTTWMQEMVYLIREGVDKEADTTLEDRFPYLEYVYPGIKEIAKMEGPRMIKSHLPYSLLPDDVRVNKAKIIYLVRNPKDVMVSYYHFARMLTEVNYKETFAEFFDQFVNNKVAYGPWWNHIASFYLHRDEENILIVSYEDMHENPVKVIGKVAEFLGRRLSEEEKLVVAAKTSFTIMSANPNSNYSWYDDLGLRNKQEAKFMRKGKVGDWKNYMDEEMSKRVDEIVDRYLRPLGCNFTYKIDKS